MKLLIFQFLACLAIHQANSDEVKPRRRLEANDLIQAGTLNSEETFKNFKLNTRNPHLNPPRTQDITDLYLAQRSKRNVINNNNHLLHNLNNARNLQRRRNLQATTLASSNKGKNRNRNNSGNNNARNKNRNKNRKKSRKNRNKSRKNRNKNKKRNRNKNKKSNNKLDRKNKRHLNGKNKSFRSKNRNKMIESLRFGGWFGV